MTTYVRLLGHPAVKKQDGWLELPVGKTSALIYYLAYQEDWVSRDELLYLFWPDSPEHDARQNLRPLLSKIRRFDFVNQLDGDKTRLRWQVQTDVRLFRESLAKKQWSEAWQCYQGELLSGFGVPQLSEFEGWLALERGELHNAWREAALALTDELESTNRYSEAAELLARLYKSDSLDEAVLRRYLIALYLKGERGEALQAYNSFAQMLLEEVGSEPEDITQGLLQSIQRGEVLENVIVSTQAIRERSKRQAIPIQATPFIGRANEKAELYEKLSDPACRLLTIVGPGGIGKTRLAIEVATEHQGAFKDNIYFVLFDAVSSPVFMISALASTLHLSFFGSQDPKEQLLDYLKDKKMLLILDNLEHLLKGTGLIADILSTSPDIRILATSRERLNLHAEWVFDLDGLIFPTDEYVENPQDYDAIKLFVQAAKKARPQFMLAENVRGITRICQRVGGMPLAIELAASWLPVLGTDEISEELQKGLSLLGSSLRDLPERHRDMRAVFDISWQRLSTLEQTALSNLAVFYGGFSKEAAVAVADVGLPLLLALSNKSFIHRASTGHFTQHPLIWQYLREKAENFPITLSRTQERHAAYFTAFLYERKDQIQRLEGKTAHEEIGRELGNVREAWFWAVAHKREDLLNQAAESLYVFLNETGSFHEAELLFSTVVTSLANESVTFGRMLFFLGGCYNFITDFDSGIRTLQQGLPILRSHGAKREEALSLLMLGSCYSFSNYSLEKVTAIWQRCLHLFQEVGDLAHEGEVLGLLAEYTSDPEAAQGQFREALRLLRASGKCFGVLGGIALTLSNFAQFFAHVRGAYLQAIELTEEALQIEQVRGESYRMVWYLNTQAEYSIYQGDYCKAEALLVRARLTGESLGLGWGKLELDRALCGLGQLAYLRAKPEEAKRYLARVIENTNSHGDAFGTRARAMDTLSRIRLAEGDSRAAQDLCQNALYYFSSTLNPQKAGRDWAKAHCLSHFSDIALARDDTQAAQQHLHEALKIAQEWHLLPIALHLCLGFARLYLHLDNKKRAARLLQVAANHPAGIFETKEEAQKLLVEYKHAISDPVPDKEGGNVLFKDILADLLATS